MSDEQITDQTEWQEEIFSPNYDLAGLAIGALDADEADHVRSVVTANAQLRAELAELESVTTALALFVPRQHINRGRSAGIRSRLIARAASSRDRRIPVARRTAELVRPKAPPPGTVPAQTRPQGRVVVPPTAPTPHTPSSHPLPPPRPSGAIRGSVWVGLAVILAAIVGGLQEWRLRQDRSEVRASVASRDSSLSQQLEDLQASAVTKDNLIQSLTGPNMKVIDLVSSAALDPMARIFWDQKTHEWTLRSYRLRQPNPGKTYQVWLIVNTTPAPISIGTFEPDGQGRATFTTTQELAKGALVRIAISEEPAGGSSIPAGPIVAAGK